MKLPIPTTTQIKRISQTLAGSIDEYSSLLSNVTVEIVDDAPRCTRRRGIEIRPDGDASAAGIGTSFGRGLAYSTDNPSGALYIANYNSIYVNNYSGAALGSLGAVVNAPKYTRVFFAPIQDATYEMVVIDPANNDGFVLNPAAMVSIAALPAFPYGGCVFLNGRVFVTEEDTGRIYNSDLNAPTTGYTDFVTAERSPDFLVAIERHHDHIVAFGNNSIEFFYHAEDPGATGSPLRRRQDVYYDIGLLDMNAFSRIHDTIYFLGASDKGEVALYKLENFQVVKMSDSRFNRWLNVVRDTAPDLTYVTAFSYEGRSLIAVTKAEGDGARAHFDDATETFIFEEDGRYYNWNADGVSETTRFPLNGWSFFNVQPGTLFASGPGLTAEGDLITFKSRTDAPNTFKDDLGGTETEFTSTIEFNDFDGDVTGWKFCHAVEPLGDYEAGCEFNLSWSDEGGAYNTPRTLTKANRQRAVSCGRFSRRKFKLTTTDDSDVIDEHMELEGLDVTISPGQY